MLKAEEISGLDKVVEPLEGMRVAIEEKRKSENEYQLSILNEAISNQPLRKPLSSIVKSIQEACVMKQVRNDPLPLKIVTNNNRVFTELQQWCQRFTSLSLEITKVDLFELPVMFIFGEQVSPLMPNVLKPLMTTVFDLSEE